MVSDRLTDRLAHRVARDEANATLVQEAAAAKLPHVLVFKPERDIVRGTPAKQVVIAEALDRDRLDLRKIVERPFDAMLEVEVNRASPVLWYAHRDTSGNQSITTDTDVDIRVLSWTHPGIQAGLSGEIGEATSLHRAGYVIKSVKPIARARLCPSGKPA
jgi:hypothetical protein